MPTRPCWVEINTRSLEDNYRLLEALAAPHAELLAIVKADSYGHSLALCAPAAVRAGAGWLGVTSVEEGVAARELVGSASPAAGNSETRILVIGGVFPGQGSGAHRQSPDARRLGAVASAGIGAGCAGRAAGARLAARSSRDRHGNEPPGRLTRRAGAAAGALYARLAAQAGSGDDASVCRRRIGRPRDRPTSLRGWTQRWGASPLPGTLPNGSTWATPPRCWPARQRLSRSWPRATG